MAVTVRGKQAQGKSADEPEREIRRARFKAALKLARLTAKKWCAAEGGVTDTQLYAVLKGDRESEKLLGKIDDFVARHAQTDGFDALVASYLPPVAA